MVEFYMNSMIIILQLQNILNLFTFIQVWCDFKAFKKSSDALLVYLKFRTVQNCTGLNCVIDDILQKF